MDQKNGRARYTAFIPSKKTRNISVYRIGNCKEKRIWRLGDVFVAPIRKLDVLARADFQSNLAFDEGLSIVADPSPHPRHAIVTNWPEDKAQITAVQINRNRGAEVKEIGAFSGSPAWVVG